jgi:hypothetical protein
MWPRVGSFWPGTAREESLEQFRGVFAMYGYEYCGDAFLAGSDGLESGYEKLALYMKGAEFTHVARQLPDGTWISKLGGDIDIVHDAPNDLPDDGPHRVFYGIAMYFFKRPRGFIKRLQAKLVQLIAQNARRQQNPAPIMRGLMFQPTTRFGVNSKEAPA